MSLNAPIRDWHGKRVWIVGASSGIGEQTVLAFLAAGFRVYAVARRVDRMTALVEKGATASSMDVTDDASMVAGIDRVIADASASSGRVNVVPVTLKRWGLPPALFRIWIV